MNKKKELNVLLIALKQRESALGYIKSHKEYLHKQSDFGWFLTLGSEAFGMLMAVSAGMKAREIGKIESKLTEEIFLLKMAVIKSQNK